MIRYHRSSRRSSGRRLLTFSLSAGIDEVIVDDGENCISYGRMAGLRVELVHIKEGL